MKSPLTLDTVVQIAPGVVSATVAGEIVILDPDNAKYYGVEGAGVEVWQMLSEPRRVRELRDMLMDVYDVEKVRCEQDLLAILDGMQADGLIEMVGV